MRKQTLNIAEVMKRLEQDPELQKASREKIKLLQTALTSYAREQADRAVHIEQRSKSNVLRFAVIGDTHLGSLYERIDVVRACVKLCEDEGIEDIFHAGDVLDGHKTYQGQEFELHKHGWEAQSEWFKSEMPKSGKVRIYFITGNHDAKFKHAAGIEVGKALSELRPDWRFIGTDTGEIVLTARDGRPLRVALIHPDGGASYAISYRLQKIIEQWSGGSKPDILACGHYHKSLMLPQYRNVCGICVGTSQDQTPYMKRRGLAAHIGFWIVEAVPSKKRGELWSRYKAEFINFYQKANVA